VAAKRETVAIEVSFAAAFSARSRPSSTRVTVTASSGVILPDAIAAIVAFEAASTSPVLSSRGRSSVSFGQGCPIVPKQTGHWHRASRPRDRSKASS
jgi:hypothetical protein